MDTDTLYFGTRVLKREHLEGKRILEVGSRNVNGTYRDFVTGHSPAEYVGIDIEDGPGVDRIVSVHDLGTTFGEGSFNGVICTNVLEHVWDWRGAVKQMHRVLKIEGWIIVTLPAPGFPFHEYPADYWRGTQAQLRAIFDGYWIVATAQSNVSCIMAVRGALDTIHVWVNLHPVGLRERVVRWMQDGPQLAGVLYRKMVGEEAQR